MKLERCTWELKPQIGINRGKNPFDNLHKNYHYLIILRWFFVMLNTKHVFKGT